MTVSPAGGRPLRLASIPIVLCVLFYCMYKISSYIDWPALDFYHGLNRPEQALAWGAVLGLGAVQIRFALHRPSRRGALVLLAAQVVLTYGPHLLLGTRWETPAAFIVATLLLTFAGWLSWTLVGLAVAVDVAVWIVFLPGDVLEHTNTMTLMYVAIAAIANGLLLFGMIRLGELVRDLHRTRSARAPFEVARERLRLARGLQNAVGRRLASIITTCQRAAAEPGRDGEAAQVVATEARQAAAQVRAVTDDYRDRSLAGEIEAARTVLAAAGVEVVADAVPDGLPTPIDAVLAAVLRRMVVAALRGAPPQSFRIGLDGSARMHLSFAGGAPATSACDGISDEIVKLGGRFEIDADAVDVRIPVQLHRSPTRRTPQPVAAAPWLAWGIMAVLEFDIFITVMARGSGVWHWVDPLSPTRMALVIAVALPLSLLQLHHVRPRSGRVPPGWKWTISFQIVLVGVGMAIGGNAFAGNVYGAALAGVILFHLRRPWSWILAGVMVMAPGAIESIRSGLPLLYGWPFNSTWELYAMIAVATLCRLPVAAEELIAARQELERLAVLRERLRIARDTHDLLGFQLSTVAVKAALAARLSATEPSKARIHLAEAGRVSEQALNSLRSITAEPGGLTFAEEVEGARSMLSAADVAVTVELGAMPGPSVESALAIILREAVTNVVRHSRATICQIVTSPGPGAIRLEVTNDGVPETSDAVDDPAGDGLPSGNGLANLRARAREAGGQLTTELRGDRFTLVAEVRSDPARLGRDPDGIDSVAGVELGDRRSEVVAHRAV